jgi:MFS family permease
LGGALAPPLAGLLLLHYGWRMPFVLFGAIGALGSLAWLYWFRNRPEEHPAMTREELERIQAGRIKAGSTSAGIPWLRLLNSTRLWCLLGAAFGLTMLWQFYITWFPTYLRERREMTIGEAGFYASIPFVLGVGATWLGGILTDFIGRRSDDRRARTVIGFTSLLSAATLMSAGVWCPEARLAAVLMGCAAGAVDLCLGAAWASALDIGGASGGAVSGLMNAASNCAGFASPALMGWVLQQSGDWDSVLLFGAGTTALSAFLWLFVNPRRRAEPVTQLARAGES